jgi:hypothetical protein
MSKVNPLPVPSPVKGTGKGFCAQLDVLTPDAIEQNPPDQDVDAKSPPPDSGNHHDPEDWIPRVKGDSNFSYEPLAVPGDCMRLSLHVASLVRLPRSFTRTRQNVTILNLRSSN